MMEKFRDKYRLSSIRLKNWDYRWVGIYYITICTRNREHYFGEIREGRMNLTGAGILADVFWHEIKNHTKNVELGEFVVMPDHIHGILVLTLQSGIVETLHATSLPRFEADPPPMGMVETLHATSLPHSEKDTKMAAISPKSGSVSTIIRSYKSAVSKHARRLGIEMAWHERFWEHLVQDANDYRHIADYINDNVRNWDKG